MRLVFIDDSNQKNPLRQGLGDLIALGAVSVPEDSVAAFADDLLEIRKDLGIPEGEEIKWKPPRNSYLANVGLEATTALRTRMLEAAIARNIRSMVVIIDHSAAYVRLSDAEVGKVVLKWLYERISMHLADHGELGIVFADKPSGGASEEGRWLQETLRLTNDGTEYVEPGRVVLPIVTAPSHHLPHLQLADLVVGASTAAVAGRPRGLELKDLLRQLAHRHSLGDINGAGVVIFPDHPNLYYWAFGETGYSIPSKQAGVELPFEGYRYFEDDGLPPTPGA